MEFALRNLLPKIVKSGTRYDIRSFQGKSDLIKNLPSRLKAYYKRQDSTLRIIILVDEDREDCLKLKARLEKIAQEVGFITRSKAGAGNSYQVVNRIAVEELEAWFFGDVEALLMAYPKLKQISKTIKNRKEFLYPENISNGTWEMLERLLQKAGYYAGGLPKLEVARKVSAFMEPERNISKSFQLFRKDLMELTF